MKEKNLISQFCPLSLRPILEGYAPDFAPVSPLLRRASRGAIVPRPRNDGGRRSSHRATGWNSEKSLAYRPKALQATPVQSPLLRRSVDLQRQHCGSSLVGGTP